MLQLSISIQYKQDQELIFQQLYCNKFVSKIRMQNLFQKNNNFRFGTIL
ncbi:hypothetical protein LEP1GSC081_3353 [Leptospira kirschneri str. H1]|uniref:Uncharacterized protein n=1 Tax=Leptospira kirschneri str. H1 TaxID=1049966 RepID=A0A0E2B3Q9_9LEPT|nr:hypothetical protein LEP1GSC081_3353 [Leptospira kirschneri str. H1]